MRYKCLAEHRRLSPWGLCRHRNKSERGGVMGRRLWCSVLILAVLAGAAGLVPAAAGQPEGTLTVAVATFGNERWLPQLYPGAEDVVLKPMLENLLNRDLK